MEGKVYCTWIIVVTFFFFVWLSKLKYLKKQIFWCLCIFSLFSSLFHSTIISLNYIPNFFYFRILLVMSKDFPIALKYYSCLLLASVPAIGKASCQFGTLDNGCKRSTKDSLIIAKETHNSLVRKNFAFFWGGGVCFFLQIVNLTC